jgi:hypothetical protein
VKETASLCEPILPTIFGTGSPTSSPLFKRKPGGNPIPARLPAALPLFNVPEKMVRVFDRDLRAAGIPKRDERGRTLNVHALRTTFGTLLSKGGASPCGRLRPQCGTPTRA